MMKNGRENQSKKEKKMIEKREKKEKRKIKREKEKETLKPRSKSLSVREMMKKEGMMKTNNDFLCTPILDSLNKKVDPMTSDNAQISKINIFSPGKINEVLPDNYQQLG